VRVGGVHVCVPPLTPYMYVDGGRHLNHLLSFKRMPMLHIATCTAMMLTARRVESRRRVQMRVRPARALFHGSIVRQASASWKSCSYPEHRRHTSAAVSPVSFRRETSTPGAHSNARSVSRFTESCVHGWLVGGGGVSELHDDTSCDTLAHRSGSPPLSADQVCL
jgi:hypothetical protein